MKKLFIIIFLGLIFTTLSAQDYTISFVGLGESTTVESVEVENINTGKILAFPGNQVLRLVGEGVGVSNLINNRNGDIKIFPNPITESSTIEFTLPKSSMTNVEIFDILGKEVASTTNILVAGHHSFIISGLRRGIYAIKVYSNEFSNASKLMSNSQTSLKPSIIYDGIRNLPSSFVNMKSTQTDVVMLYKEGDRLKITAKSGLYCTTITEIPDQSKVIRIPFIKCLDADGNNYSVVKIGDQYWTVENLKTTRYNDKTPILNVTVAEDWANLKTGAWCNHDNLESNGEIYGRLYNWYAVGTGKLAPAGWHVPTDNEWTILENYLIDNGYNYDDSIGIDRIAKSLCAETGWQFSNKAGNPGYKPEKNNSTGFTALPGSYHNFFDGIFGHIGMYGYWWSSTESEDFHAYYWNLYYNSKDLLRDNYFSKIYGLSVRLVRDDDYVTNDITIPLVETNEVTEITQNTAISGGNISSDGGATVIERGVCWSTNQSPTMADNKTTDDSGVGSFISAISGLTENTTYYVRAYATNSKGTGYGREVMFKTDSSSIVFNPNIIYGTMTDIEGNIYKTVQIGNQVWMAENLKTTKYNDGTPIPNVTEDGKWYYLKTGAYCNYGNLESNANIYGRLYNWYAVETGKLAPEGWHVPTYAEMAELADYLGGFEIAGGKLKETGTIHWQSPNVGATNESGYTALPCGLRNYIGTFNSIGNYGLWWNSTEYDEYHAYNQYMSYDNEDLNKYIYRYKESGLSVRCVKD